MDALLWIILVYLLIGGVIAYLRKQSGQQGFLKTILIWPWRIAKGS